MNPIKKLSVLLLSLMMLSFASCELLEDKFTFPKPDHPQEPNYPKALITDSTTTNTVWALQSVMLDNSDFTQEYKYFYDRRMYRSYLDIRTDGTFTGFLREDRYYARDGAQWEYDGDTLRADHAYVVRRLTEKELVLERHEHFSIFKDNWSGDVMTYTFQKVDADEYYQNLLYSGEWVLKGVDVDGDSFEDYPFGFNQSMYLRKDGEFMGKFLFQSVGSNATTPLTWNLGGNDSTLTIGEESYTVKRVSLTELVLVREGNIEFITPDGIRLTGGKMTFKFEAGEDTEFYEPEEAIGKFIVTDRWEVESIQVDGREIATPQDKREQYLELKEDATFRSRLLHYVWEEGSTATNTWELRDTQLVLEHAGGLTKYCTITMVSDTELEMLIINDEGAVYTYRFKRN